MNCLLEFLLVTSLITIIHISQTKAESDCQCSDDILRRLQTLEEEIRTLKSEKTSKTTEKDVPRRTKRYAGTSPLAQRFNTMRTIEDVILGDSLLTPSPGKRQHAGGGPSEVAFHATLLESPAIVDARTNIVFDEVRTNIGNAFDPVSGVFSCPETGTYFFTMTIVSNLYNKLKAAIMQDGRHELGTAISDYNEGSVETQGGTSAIVKLYVGETVSVQIRYPSGAHGITGRRLTSFTGYRLFRG